MKKIFVAICLLCSVSASFAQTEDNSQIYSDDSTHVDTLNKNLIGLNVFPAFGILGNGQPASTKIFIQYKHLYEKMNLRASINYISFYKNYDNIDIMKFITDTLITNGDTIKADSLMFRKFYYDVYSYDARIGVEAAFPGKGYRFYIGTGLIGGYQFTGEYYYHYTRKFTGYPVEYININPLYANYVGYRKTSFLKAGFDFTLGVDINISPNCVISVQYAPELVYYHQLKQDVLDPDNYYVRELSNGFQFIPDYVDFVVNIRF